jgi:lipopolysaccharide transport system permease protein
VTPVQITDGVNAAAHPIEPVDIPKHGNGGDAAQRLRIIEPGKATLRFLGRDLWRSRELLYFLTWRDIKVRYKQAMLGVLWAVLQPIITMVVLSMFFGRLAGIAKHTDSIPYPVFVYSGLLPWNFFASALSSGGNSVLSNSALITKVRFPRI